MELLLTSSGLRNETLRGALRDMLGKPFGSANVVYVPTASVAEPGDHGWLVADMSRLHGLGWREFDVLELNGLPRPMVLDRLLHADVIYAGGGNHYHLARSITGNDLAGGFLEALESRVYVGQASSTNCTWVRSSGARAAAMSRCQRSVACHSRNPGLSPGLRGIRPEPVGPARPACPASRR